jgi:hypothetical protein
VETFLQIIQIIALISVAAFCIAGLVIMIRLRKIVTGFGEDMAEVSSRAVPVLENLEFITSRLKSISETVDDQVTLLGDSLGSIRDVTDNIVALERKVQAEIEGPILETLAFIGAILKGVKTFMDRLRT